MMSNQMPTLTMFNTSGHLVVTPEKVIASIGIVTCNGTVCSGATYATGPVCYKQYHEIRLGKRNIENIPGSCQDLNS